MVTKKRVTVIALAIAALIGGHILNERRFAGDIADLTGIVRSVEAAPPNDAGFKSVAVVELPNGASVRAKLLPACIAFPGQLAHLVGGRSSYFGRSYVVMKVEEAK